MYARNNDFVFNEVDGELVMMNLENGAYVSLNESGKSIWHILETPVTDYPTKVCSGRIHFPINQ